MSHSHHHDIKESKTTSIVWALVLNGSFCILELIAGIFSNSLSILSDAVHDLGDTIALGSALFFEKHSTKSPDTSFTFGYRRFSVLSAFVNSLILFGGSVGIIIVSLQRLFHPEVVSSEIMFWMSIVGIIVNVFAMSKLRPHSHSHNHSVLSLHLLEDVLGWVAVFIGSIIIYFTHWYIIDPILSICVSVYIGFNAQKSVRSVLRIFLQGVPTTIDINKVQQTINEIPNILSIHSFRIWTLDDEDHIVSFHVVVDASMSSTDLIILKHAIKKVTALHHIHQTTVEFEFNTEICNEK